MREIDYSKWVDSVRHFSEALRHLPGEINVCIEIEPPIDEETLAVISQKWRSGLPSVLRKLWSEGSSAINCKYWWMPPNEVLPQLHEIFESEDFIYGGVRFLRPSDIFPGNSGVDPDDEDMMEIYGDAGFALWQRCAVFLHVGNGDCLGLDPEGDHDDPSVVYLGHDDETTRVISRSFTAFLTAWQQLSYIGPEFWLLDYWIDGERALIDTSMHRTDELRALLTPRQQTTKA